MKFRRWPDLGPLAVSSGCVVAVAMLGGLATEIGPWYRGLRKPSFQPPDWLFGPAWTLIFALVALAAADMWRKAQSHNSRKLMIVAFGVNGFLNVLWSVLFFKLQRPDYALAEVVLLWLSVSSLLLLARYVSSGSVWLLAPYLAWVTFAAVLNAAVVTLN